MIVIFDSQFNKSVDILLDPDSSVGQGIYLPEMDEPEYCNANSTALWELLLLKVLHEGLHWEMIMSSQHLSIQYETSDI
ncbi:hypothetical protein PR048_024457 [Dryococelus australis]|uniref:CCAAT-binding factor domain-containing protein n=1 Tax=Dryococelus australis TaxID=614101 RepID=A0ABQ9GNN0_9NEOP|nr:hypothetical protein PR048_024457 [Dryococelus australis]